MHEFHIPDWSTDEFLETELGQAASTLEERMDMALGEGFTEGNVTQKLDLLFEGLADIDEIAYYCARVTSIYTHDVIGGGATLPAAFQGAVSQAICLGILMERARAR